MDHLEGIFHLKVKQLMQDTILPCSGLCVVIELVQNVCNLLPNSDSVCHSLIHKARANE